MTRTLFIVAVAALLAACSTTIGRSAAVDTATMGAPSATLQDFRSTVGPKGNGP